MTTLTDNPGTGRALVPYAGSPREDAEQGAVKVVVTIETIDVRHGGPGRPTPTPAYVIRQETLVHPRGLRADLATREIWASVYAAADTPPPSRRPKVRTIA